MSSEVTNTTITTFQGDTCNITFTDLEEGMNIFFSVRDKKTNALIFPEMNGLVDENGDVSFVITPELSNRFIVKPSEGFASYYYGIKEVDSETGEEHTILLGQNPHFSDKYIIKVYLKKAEGLNEENS